MRIATVAGIPIRLHWSFMGLILLYLVIGLFTVGLIEVLQGAFVATALFVSVVLHELGHALAARMFGIRTAHITLYPFGGIAAITRAPSRPREELIIALAGPAVNFVLAVVFGGLWGAVGGWPIAAIAALNIIMGVFNLVPAFPMDGGRVLRALLADRMGWAPASRLAMRIGRIFAWSFIAIGLVAWLPSLILVGGFLLFALAAEGRRLEWMTTHGPWRPSREVVLLDRARLSRPGGAWP